MQRDEEAREGSAADDAAVAAYRLSMQAGNPLSERRLAQMFGAHIPSLGTSQNRPGTTSAAAPSLAGHRGHGLTAGPGAGLASDPRAMTGR